MDGDASFGHWLRLRRKALQLSCAELARRVACATITLRKIEADERRPSQQLAAQLAAQLDIPASARAIFIRVARGELGVSRLAPPQQIAEHPVRVARAHLRTTVPIPPTPLIGRAAEVAAVAAMLRRSDVMLLSLTGAPGIGKTRLAIEVATKLQDSFSDGIYFLQLASIYDPDLVLPTIAQAFAISEAPGQPLLERLQVYLHDRQVLLVLDNLEQVLDAAPQLAAMLTISPQLRLLVTSRVALRLSAEHRFAVPPLALPPPRNDIESRSAPGTTHSSSSIVYPSVELFVQRARVAVPTFALSNTNAMAVAEICQRLDGLPLAIELAAARMTLFAPSELREQLDQRFALLTGGAVDLPMRQQTLRGAIDWSYELLDAHEQALFWRLGVFVGGCTLEAASAVCDSRMDEPGRPSLEGHPSRDQAVKMDVLDGLTALIDKSLLQREASADGRSRFTMLETIREYAREKLAENGELELVQERHLAYYLAFVEAAEPQIVASDELVWLARLEQDHDNLRAALAWAVDRDPARALRLGAALASFWHMRGYLSEGRQWLQRVLTIADSPSTALIKALHGAATLAHSQEDDLQAETLYTESLALAQAHDDQRRVALLLNDLGEMALNRGDTQRAMMLHLKALVLARSLSDQRAIAQLLIGLGIASRTAGDREAATAYFQESLAIYQHLEDRRGVAWSLHALGQVARDSGAYAQAFELLAEALALARAIADYENIVWLLYDYGCMLLHQHDLANAAKQFAESAHFAHDLGLRQAVALNLDGLASVRIRQGAPVRAAQLLSAADVQWKRATSSYWGSAERAEHERAIIVARGQLDEATFAEAWAEGQALPLEQAVSEALDFVRSF